MDRRPPKHFIGPFFAENILLGLGGLPGRPEWAPHWEDRDKRRTLRAVSDAHTPSVLVLALTTDYTVLPSTLIKPAFKKRESSTHPRLTRARPPQTTRGGTGGASRILEATGSAFELPATGIFPVEIGRAAADFFALLGFRSALLSSVCPPI
jgi:hypothetical protein